jgi:RimJ/RimL family protein N-acetyltransferase
MSGILHPNMGRVIGAVPPGWLVVELTELDVADDAGVEAYVAMAEAARSSDAPWWPPLTVHRQRMAMTHGWDGEVGRHFLVVDAGAPVGHVGVYTSSHDNLDLAWLEVAIHPLRRRRGLGTAAIGLAGDAAAAMGRTKVGWFGWEGERTRGFAASLGVEQKSVAVCRRQHLHELAPGLADRVYDDALPSAHGYELLRIGGPMPDELVPAFLEATAAINDAPRDELDMEDEVFTAERNRGYERAQLASGFRVYRILARHQASGEIAGVTSVTVDGETPTLGHQQDTSVVRAHRGHRLGLLLKSDMVRWLTDAEPRLETVDTFNAESNDHMVAVNERLGYRVMDRELQFQASL